MNSRNLVLKLACMLFLFSCSNDDSQSAARIENSSLKGSVGETSNNDSVDGSGAMQLALTGVSGKISANLLDVPVFTNTLGTAFISWSTTGTSDAQVYLSDNGEPEKLFGQSPNWRAATAPWIALGRSYTFKLYAGLQKRTLLGEVTVRGVSPITASPVTFSSLNKTLGTTMISWDAKNYPRAVVYVTTDGGKSESLFGRAPTYQNAAAPWIQRGFNYDFKLYASDLRNKLLGQVRVASGSNYFFSFIRSNELKDSKRRC
jgi:hypothetical protein